MDEYYLATMVADSVWYSEDPKTYCILLEVTITTISKEFYMKWKSAILRYFKDIILRKTDKQALYSLY